MQIAICNSINMGCGTFLLWKTWCVLSLYEMCWKKQVHQIIVIPCNSTRTMHVCRKSHAFLCVNSCTCIWKNLNINAMKHKARLCEWITFEYLMREKNAIYMNISFYFAQSMIIYKSSFLISFELKNREWIARWNWNFSSNQTDEQHFFANKFDFNKWNKYLCLEKVNWSKNSS